MTRWLTLAGVLMMSASMFAQEYSFRPVWKKGQKKVITMTQRERSFENDSLETDTTTTEEILLTVVGATETHYTLRMLRENVAFRKVMELYEELDEDFSGYENLELDFRVDRQTGEVELINWEDAQRFMNEGLDQLSAILSGKSTEAASAFNLLLAPVREMYRSQENIEAQMEEHLGFLFRPYAHTYVKGERISETESSENPFNPMTELSVTTHLELVEVYEDEQHAMFEQTVEFDLDEFLEMMRSMMMRMGEAFGASDSSMSAHSKEIEDFQMDITNQQTITYDMESTWVIAAETKAEVTVTDPGKGVKRSVQQVQYRVSD